jgi:hypothetical protein
LEWKPEACHDFSQLIQDLLHAPDLSLHVGQSFHLYVTERKGMVLGVITHNQGLTQQLLGYLSKEIDVIAKVWPACLHVIVNIAILILEATKLILGMDLTIHTPHIVSGLLSSRGS